MNNTWRISARAWIWLQFGSTLFWKIFESGFEKVLNPVLKKFWIWFWKGFEFGFESVLKRFWKSLEICKFTLSVHSLTDKTILRSKLKLRDSQKHWKLKTQLSFEFGFESVLKWSWKSLEICKFTWSVHSLTVKTILRSKLKLQDSQKHWKLKTH